MAENQHGSGIAHEINKTSTGLSGLGSLAEELPRASRESSPSSQYRARETPRRIHILGTGAVGKFIAHSLRGIANPPPITLLLHRPVLVREWRNEKEQVTIVSKTITESRAGFDVELALPYHETGTDTEEIRQKFRGVKNVPENPIHNLIVAVKAPHTVAALKAIDKRLSPESTVCFMQNGMGVTDEVNEKLFPDPFTRPTYMQGVISHGLFNVRPFTADHAGQGTIALAIHPRTVPAKASPFKLFGFSRKTESSEKPNYRESLLYPASSRYLLRTLTRTPILAAVAMTPQNLALMQLEKLAVNSIINPLTALLDARNGTLLYNFHLTRVMRLMLAETAIVLRSLPELRGLPNLNVRFSAGRLESMTVGVANRTAGNISSMLQDVRRGKETEIEYINGYIVKRGEQLGFKAVMNYLVKEMVHGKQGLIDREIEDEVPFEVPKEDVTTVRRQTIIAKAGQDKNVTGEPGSEPAVEPSKDLSAAANLKHARQPGPDRAAQRSANADAHAPTDDLDGKDVGANEESEGEAGAISKTMHGASAGGESAALTMRTLRRSIARLRRENQRYQSLMKQHGLNWETTPPPPPPPPGSATTQEAGQGKPSTGPDGEGRAGAL